MYNHFRKIMKDIVIFIQVFHIFALRLQIVVKSFIEYEEGEEYIIQKI